MFDIFPNQLVSLRQLFNQIYKRNSEYQLMQRETKWAQVILLRN
jgi:hypothetical protein